jgi:hypothetical protein
MNGRTGLDVWKTWNYTDSLAEEKTVEMLFVGRRSRGWPKSQRLEQAKEDIKRTQNNWRLWLMNH